MPILTLHLASASPRRSALLHQIGVQHRIQPVDVDETVRPGESPIAYVSRLSKAKAAALSSRLDPMAVTLGADTCVALADEIFGKPADEADCVHMLARLSANTHQVHTAVTVQSGTDARTAVSSSEVTFRSLSRQECVAYWQSGEPRDKAGGYAIQGRAALFVQRMAGSYSGIVGLPLFETAQLLEAFGFVPAHLLAGEAA